MGDDNEGNNRPFPPQPPYTFQSQRNQYDLNSKIMLTAIISLSVVVVLVTILHIYARYVLRRQARRRATTIRQLGLAMMHTSEPPKAGLDPAVIASLPIFVYKQNTANDEKEKETTECAVCLSNLEDDEMARLLPNCKHTFHVECIDRWLGSQSTCPICRAEAEPRFRLVPEPRESVVGAAGVLPTAPSLENSTLTNIEGTSNGGIQSSAKVTGSSSRLSSFRRMLSRERSSRRIQSCGQEEDGLEDLERL